MHCQVFTWKSMHS